MANPDYLDCLYSEHELKKSGLWNAGRCRHFLEKLKKCNPKLVSPRDSQAFLLLLSTMLLFDKFRKEKLTPQHATAVPSGISSGGLCRIA